MPREELTRCTVLLSGGIDSSVVLATLEQGKTPVRALFVDYGQPAVAAERRASRAIAARYDCDHFEVTVQGIDVASGGEIRGRNDMLISIALAASPDSLIATGTHAGTPYADCSDAHATAWQALLDSEYAGGRRVVMPLLGLRKGDILALASSLGVPLPDTYSCETGSEPCLTCRSCRDREVLVAGAQ